MLSSVYYLKKNSWYISSFQKDKMNQRMVDNEMLVIPLKVTTRTDLYQPLHSWIDNLRSISPSDKTPDPKDCIKSLKRISSIRNCISSSICAHYAHKSAISENALSDCIEYHSVLEECEKLGFPVRDGEAHQLMLSWNCAFEQSHESRMIRSNIRYERCCVLFNISAFESYLASTEDFLTKAGLARAVQRYNLCSGIFAHIRTNLIDLDDPNPSNDLTPSCLRMCEKLMMAQGQACAYEMAKSHMSSTHSVLAKLSMGAAELYGEALLFASERMVKSRMVDGVAWNRYMKFHSAVYRALAEYHEAKFARTVADNGKDVGFRGIEIARLIVAEKLTSDAIGLGKRQGSSLDDFSSLLRLIKQRRQEAGMYER